MSITIRHGVAAALMLGAGTAGALPLSEYDGSVINVYFGGATATDNALENLFRLSSGGICAPGTISVYRGANQRVVFCRVTADQVPGFPAAPAGAKVAFHKESRGGSSNGVIPLIDVASNRAHDLQWLNMSALTDALCPATAVGASGPLGAYTNRPCSSTPLTPQDTAASSAFDAHGGISDNEAGLASPPPSASDIGKLEARSGVGIIFGVPVTLNLYRALQRAQGLAENDLEANVPSLTRPQIRALYSGNVTDWNTFKVAGGAGLAEAQAGANQPADTTVYLCKRVAASGTQASFESYWLAQRCEAGTPTFPNANDGSTEDDIVWTTADPNNGTVNAAPSSGNVRSCLNIMHTANRWAIGVLSTEVTASQLTNIRMVRVDGVAPTLVNVANGKYDFFTENTVNRIKTGQPGALPAGDLRRVIVDYVASNIGRTGVVSGINSDFAGRPWGNGGIIGIPGGANVPPTVPTTAAAMTTNPVNTQSVSTLGSTNNCNPRVTTFPTPVN